MPAPVDILKQYWGHTAFRPLQEDIVHSVLQGCDTVALLPTGGGKSVCFQVPALMKEGICLVISPLIALMNDQVNKLKNQGIKAMALTGNIAYSELDILLDNCIYGNYKFLYLSPERLQQELVQQRILKMNISLVAIDEAHCISQWGNDFRPAYKIISIIRKLQPQVPFIALTATATAEVLADTVNELELTNPQIFKKSFQRENLAYITHKEEDKLYRIEQILKKYPGPAIVYAGYRNYTLKISEFLNKKGFQATYFHGGITTEEKNKRLKSWLDETTPVMVATNAFGMGIDKPNVRTVIHYNIPESIENYFQEAGRAGRDGELSKAILLYSGADLFQAEKQYTKSLPSVEDVKNIYAKLCSYFRIPYGEGEFTAHSFNFDLFCRQYNLNAPLSYNSLQALDRLGVIKLSQQFERKTSIRFLVSSNALLHYLESDMLLSVIGKTILRIYPGIFEQPTAISLESIAGKTGQSSEEIIRTLQKMEQDNIISLELADTDASITFIEPREDDRTINRIAKDLEKQNIRKKKQVASVLFYVENNSVCKNVQLLNYFGEPDAKPCGLCNVCNNQKSIPSGKELKIITEKIIWLLEEESVLTSRDFTEKLTFTEDRIVYCLRTLLENEILKINTKNQYYLA